MFHKIAVVDFDTLKMLIIHDSYQEMKDGEKQQVTIGLMHDSGDLQICYRPVEK